MRRSLRNGAILIILLAATAVGFAQAKGTLKCVGLYLETSAKQVSYRVGGGDWVVMKAGDTIPADAKIRVNAPRDWVELTPSDNANAVYEIDGSNSGGEVIKKVADILKSEAKVVSLPKGEADPKFKNKLVVTQYAGQHVFTTADGDKNDIKYGDVLASGGEISTIANNGVDATIDLTDASGQCWRIPGNMDFTVDQILKGEPLY